MTKEKTKVNVYVDGSLVDTGKSDSRIRVDEPLYIGFPAKKEDVDGIDVVSHLTLQSRKALFV